MSQRESASRPQPESARRSSLPPDPARRVEHEIWVADEGGIRHVVFDRRSRKNAITAGMYSVLTTAVSGAAGDDATGVLLFRSAGGAFTVGDDLPEDGAAQVDPAYLVLLAQAKGEFLRALATFPKPVVAAVNGLAVGAGAMMLLYCDLVIASEFAAFEFPSARQGAVPDPASCALLEARIGLQRASEWLLLGGRIKADEVLRLGLVNAVVPLESLHSSARTRADALSRLPRHAALETKRLLRESLRSAVARTSAFTHA